MSKILCVLFAVFACTACNIFQGGSFSNGKNQNSVSDSETHEIREPDAQGLVSDTELSGDDEYTLQTLEENDDQHQQPASDDDEAVVEDEEESEEVGNDADEQTEIPLLTYEKPLRIQPMGLATRMPTPTKPTDGTDSTGATGITDGTDSTDTTDITDSPVTYDPAQPLGPKNYRRPKGHYMYSTSKSYSSYLVEKWEWLNRAAELEELGAELDEFGEIVYNPKKELSPWNHKVPKGKYEHITTETRWIWEHEVASVEELGGEMDFRGNIVYDPRKPVGPHNHRKPKGRYEQVTKEASWIWEHRVRENELIGKKLDKHGNIVQ